MHTAPGASRGLQSLSYPVMRMERNFAESFKGAEPVC